MRPPAEGHRTAQPGPCGTAQLGPCGTDADGLRPASPDSGCPPDDAGPLLTRQQRPKILPRSGCAGKLLGLPPWYGRRAGVAAGQVVEALRTEPPGALGLLVLEDLLAPTLTRWMPGLPEPVHHVGPVYWPGLPGQRGSAA